MSGIRIKIAQAITGNGNSVFKQLQRNILLKQGHLKAQCFVVSKDFKYRPALTSPALQRKAIVAFDNARSVAKLIFNSVHDHITPPSYVVATIPLSHTNLIAAIAAKEQSCLKKLFD